jgi:hypothetical protein
MLRRRPKQGNSLDVTKSHVGGSVIQGHGNVAVSGAAERAPDRPPPAQDPASGAVTPAASTQPAAALSGGFYLLALLVIFGAVIATLLLVPGPLVPVAFVFAVLMMMTIGALRLAENGRLTGAQFVAVAKAVLGKLHLVNHRSGGDKPQT